MQKENVKWIPVKNYEDFYEISDHGYIRSISENLNPTIKSDRTGYMFTRLYKHNQGKLFKVSRLMIMSFYDTHIEDEDLIVVHLNNNKTDDRIDNLILVNRKKITPQEVHKIIANNTSKRSRAIQIKRLKSLL